MKRKIRLNLAITFCLLVISCDSNDSGSFISDNRTVKVSENNTFGKVLTDKEGKTLYFFSNDTKGTSNCTNGCLDVWPVFYTADLNGIDPSLSISDFGVITRSDGQKQSTYKGWPLYYYKNDISVGQTNGDKVGNVWYVAKPDYTVMYVSAQLIGHDGKNYTASNNASIYNEGIGKTFYLTDSYGKTLYRFKNDTQNTNHFTASDFSNNNVWPIAEVNKNKFPSILNSSEFGTIIVHGKMQLTYKGWPLYYFGQDLAQGDNKGVSFPVANVWPILNTESSVAP